MDRYQLLAAEIFGYSYANYEAESFRASVRQCIEQAISEGLGGEAAVERLVMQICYRAADLAFLLKREGKPLSRYSRHLRREPDVEYYEGYFDEED